LPSSGKQRTRAPAFRTFDTTPCREDAAETQPMSFGPLVASLAAPGLGGVSSPQSPPMACQLTPDAVPTVAGDVAVSSRVPLDPRLPSELRLSERAASRGRPSAETPRTGSWRPFCNPSLANGRFWPEAPVLHFTQRPPFTASGSTHGARRTDQTSPASGRYPHYGRSDLHNGRSDLGMLRDFADDSSWATETGASALGDQSSPMAG
jgi:hypothetical protein